MGQDMTTKHRRENKGQDCAKGTRKKRKGTKGTRNNNTYKKTRNDTRK